MIVAVVPVRRSLALVCALFIAALTAPGAFAAGTPAGLPDARRMLAGTTTKTVPIEDFVSSKGDLSLDGAAARPPIRAGGAVAHVQEHRLEERADPPHDHGVQGLGNRRTGIAFPSADAASTSTSTPAKADRSAR